MSFEAGETFDRYTIEALLGEGGMGTVYRAWDPRLQRRVALKVLRTDRVADHENATDAAARMVREARLAAALEHANCVAIFDVGEHEGARFIAMEFIDGSALRRFVGDRGVPIEHKIRWLVDVARALSAAHKRGLIHRDVKPENVMVREDGAIKVLDFGIAKRAIVEGAPAAPALPVKLAEMELGLAETAAGTVSGTPHYMAPEQIRQDTLDARTDQFAWGVMAYELLTGQHPFRNELKSGSVLLAILESEPLPLTTIGSHLPSVVQATVLKALSKPPGDRFASMDHVVSVLEPFAGNSSVRSVGTPLAAPGLESVKTELATQVDSRLQRSPAKRSRAAVLSVGALAIAGVTVFALSLGGAPHAGRGAAPAGPGAPSVLAREAGALSMTAAESPSSRNADALRAYEDGLQAFRAATFETAHQAFAHAAALDPSLGSAHLRLSILSSLLANETEARQSFRHAIEFKTSLPERDRLLLEAFEPYLQREPSDVKASERRLLAAVASHPEDAELRLYLGTVQFDAGDVKDAASTFEAAIAIDPEFAEAWSYVGATQTFLGNLDRALGSFDRCLSISLGATDCIWYRVLIHDFLGDCASVEGDARSWIAKSPDDPFAYHTLAHALFALGRGEAPVRAALEQSWSRTNAAARDRLREGDELKLDIIHGDFTRALERALAYEKLLSSEPSAAPHARLAAYVVSVNEEMGRTAEASRVAARYLDQKEAWAAPTRVDDIAISTDLTPEMLAAEANSGLLPAATFSARRTEWVQTWEAKTSPTYHPLIWIYGYASPSRTASDARDALDALPRYRPLPSFTAASLQPDLSIGRVFLLGGHVDEAAASLSRAARSCLVLDEPLEHAHANLWLGRAREKAGDTAGACGAYGAVARRWGSAKPRSVSAEDAVRGRTRLGCDKAGR